MDMPARPKRQASRADYGETCCDMLVTAGATRVVTMDLHAAQLQGFFDIPLDNLHAWPLMVEALNDIDRNRLVVVIPDIGSVKLGYAYASALGVDMAIVNKTRFNASEVDVTEYLIGDVNGKDVLLADDMCSTAGTLVSAADACRKKGPQGTVAVITHGLFTGDALEKIKKALLSYVIM